MKIGIIGLPQTGKKTLFELITKHKLTENELAANKPVSGLAEIIDPRFEKLVELYKPESEARARLNVEFIPKLEKGSFAKEEVLKALDGADVLCHIVRDFQDEAVYHINGSVDSKRDIDEINSELIFNDLAFIDKRLDRLNQTLKRTSEEKMMKERDVLAKMKAQLEAELPLRLLTLTPEDMKYLVSYPLLTLKELIVVLNVSEADLKNTSKLESYKKEHEKQRIFWMQVSVKVESEIAAFESADDRNTFLAELGIKEPAVDTLKRTCIEALNLISFFGVGTDEVKQWTIPRGSSAPQAAGAIHSDLEKGFIRAEVMKYRDLAEAEGDEKKLHETGKVYLKGKDYIVEDGDILSIRFNV